MIVALHRGLKQELIELLNSTIEKDNPEWDAFAQKGIHMIHLNINSLLPKISELRLIANKTNASVIGISETKLDHTIFDGEISIKGYNLIRKDRSRHGGGVACYIKQSLSFNHKPDFCNDTESIFLELFLPKTKPILIGILYRPPNQSNFIDCLVKHFASTDFAISREIFLLGDFNFNLLYNDILISPKKYYKKFEKDTYLSTNTKAYLELCCQNNFDQKITSPTRKTQQQETLIDHILTNCSEKVTQAGVIELGLSDHDLIYCTRKIVRKKYFEHNTVSLRSLKHYSPDLILGTLRAKQFPNYTNFDCVDDAYKHFSEIILKVIDSVAPLKEVRIPNSTQPWVDNTILEKIRLRNRLDKKFKKSKLEVDRLNRNHVRSQLQKLIRTRKREYVTEKLTENINKPRDLWKNIKSLGLPSKSASESKVSLKNDNGGISFSPKEVANKLKSF